MHNFDKSILITCDRVEFESWKKCQQIERINDNIFKFKNIFIIGGSLEWKVYLTAILIACSANEKTILAVHFGKDEDKSEEIYEKLGEINQQRKSTVKEEFHIGVIMKYSLHISGTGYPEGLFYEYSKIVNSSSTDEDVAEAFDNIFNLFQKEAIKKKHDEGIEKIIEVQFPISSLLGLIKFKSNEMIEEMIKRLQKAIKAMPSESIFQEINSRSQYITKNNLPKESKLKNWLDKLNCIKNNLIAEENQVK